MLWACLPRKCDGAIGSGATGRSDGDDDGDNDHRATEYRMQSCILHVYWSPRICTRHVGSFHTTRMEGQYTSPNEHFIYTRISRSAYGVGIMNVTCLHTSDERMQILCTSCIRILYNAPTDLHTEDRQDRYALYIRLNPIYASNN